MKVIKCHVSEEYNFKNFILYFTRRMGFLHKQPFYTCQSKIK